MRKIIFTRLSFLVMIIVCLLVFTSSIFAQGRSDQAFQRVLQVQQLNTERLMALNGVEGTAIGLNNNNQIALKVFTSRPSVGGIPGNIDGVPVQVEVTGRFYALAKPPKAEKPVGSKPSRGDKTPPSTPSWLTYTTGSNQILLSWTRNTEPDLAGYNVYCSIAPYIDYFLIGTSNSETFSDNLAVPFITYYYKVTAVDTSGNESLPAQIYAMTNSPDHTPSPIGVSTGHPDITAGTIGCRVTKEIAGHTYVFALSNNHVYANCNNAYIGDNVLQPGTYDYGVNPYNAIGVLYDYVPIKFGPRERNIIDAAIALCSIETLSKSTPSYTPDSIPIQAYTGLSVKKYGRTTHLTYGTIDSVSVNSRVYYDSGFAIFINQIGIIGASPTPIFSQGGDSGSLIVTNDADSQPVGLLFAGSTNYTIANQINDVLNAFGVTIDGE